MTCWTGSRPSLLLQKTAALSLKAILKTDVLPGGATGIRTPDLLHAMQALYQLSYSPAAQLAFRQQRHASVQETG
jgi:hypothetical protein